VGLISGLVEWAQATLGPYGVPGLIVLAFTEATVSPVPPDALLPVLAYGRSIPYAIYLGLVTTVASVAGGALGYWLGDRFSPWVHRRFGGPRLAQVQGWYQQYGEWVVLVAGFSPLPFKIFTLTSGLLGLRFWPFLLAALVGRGLRFVPEAVLAARYGDQVLAWTDRYELWLLVGGLAALAGLWIWSRNRGADPSVDAAGEAP
jgi:undecaprenyl-diphosphatase